MDHMTKPQNLVCFKVRLNVDKVRMDTLRLYNSLWEFKSVQLSAVGSGLHYLPLKSELI